MNVDPGPATGRGPSGLPIGDLPDARAITIGLPVPASALAVGAHPDDIEFGCGATLARWASEGCRVRHLILTDGSKGSWNPDADLSELVTDRMEESRSAADVIDGRGDSASRPEDRVLFAGRVDGELENGVDERRDVARVIRTLRPVVLLGHDPWRRYRVHPDHRAAGFVTLDAMVAARDPHFFPELHLEPHRPDLVLLFEADAPNHLEDATGFDGAKIEALLRHRSQWRSTMGVDPTGPDDARAAATAEFAERVRRQLGDHGSLSGLAWAEAFHLIAER